MKREGFSAPLVHRNWRCQSVGLLASPNAFLEKVCFHWIAGQRKSFSKLLLRDIVPAVAKFKFSERGEIERVVGQPIAVNNSVDFFEPSCWTFALPDRPS